MILYINTTLEGEEVELTVECYYLKGKPAIIREDPNNCHPEEPTEFEVYDVKEGYNQLLWLYQSSPTFRDKVNTACLKVIEENDE